MAREHVTVRIDPDLYDELYAREGSEEAVKAWIDDAIHRRLVEESDDDVDVARARDATDIDVVRDVRDDEDDRLGREFVDDCGI